MSEVKFDEKAAIDLASKCTEWHGCASGDCPHDTYRECFDAVHIEGQRDQFKIDKAVIEGQAEENRKLREALRGVRSFGYMSQWKIIDDALGVQDAEG